ncbi:hypothetical protein SO802_024776 [Lithocarpus litseifolius]|uniref:TIR domain-containing protein n=1 Tax=Lithocarpus litseifolius TaxID=425828 RepID=A0AAW2CC67_9ROSI
MGMVVLPIFYKVDPSDIRIQRNIARAFVKYETRFKKNLKKVQRWKDALKEVANISGWHLQNRPGAEFIQDMVEMILHKLNYTFLIDAKGLIGIDSQVNKLMSLLAIGLDDVRIIGIRGMGGIGTKFFDKLKFIHLNESQNLIETPDLNKVPNLEKLVMEGCLILRTVHQSMGAHKKLTLVNFKGCKSIESLPNTFKMESLEILILFDCSKVNKIPKFMGKMEHLSGLHLDGTTITELPTSIGHLTGLASLNLRDCKNLVYLPRTIFNLKLLKNVDLTGCSKLDKLLEKMRNVESVEELDVSETPIRQVPSSIGLLTNLKGLSTRPWNELLSYVMLRRLNPMDLLLPSLAGSLTELDLSYFNLKEIPDDIGCLFSLSELNLSGNNVVCLPSSLTKLSHLKPLTLNDCKCPQSLPNLPSSITQIDASC